MQGIYDFDETLESFEKAKASSQLERFVRTVGGRGAHTMHVPADSSWEIRRHPQMRER